METKRGIEIDEEKEELVKDEMKKGEWKVEEESKSRIYEIESLSVDRYDIL